jgi:2-phosphosulfolactate phosphatase
MGPPRVCLSKASPSRYHGRSRPDSPRSLISVPRLVVHELSESASAQELAGATAVVIDVLRATTTIVTALAAGAHAVVPCLTIDDAHRAVARLPPGTGLLAGERGGLRIEGFDLGNSPAEFTPDAVNGKTIVMTTTNGTKALVHARGAEQILVGAFVNLSAVCAAARSKSNVHLLCAGTDGEVTDEDVLVAGAMTEMLADSDAWHLSDRALASRDAWRCVAAGHPSDRHARLVEAMRASLGGQNLLAVGMAGDIELAAALDRFRIAPRYHVGDGMVRGT